MHPLFIFCITLGLVSCVNHQIKLNDAIQAKILVLESKPVTDELVSYEILSLQIVDLNKYLSTYPPRIKNQEQRLHIYHKWLNIVANAENYAKHTKEQEKALHILSELYRQGHNMNVAGSDKKAEQHIQRCLQQFPDSVRCHLSASYLYLSFGKKSLDKAEKSLIFLRKHYRPNANADTEAGYVFLYLFRKNNKKALIQIERFIKNFPHHARTAPFKEIKAALLIDASE